MITLASAYQLGTRILPYLPPPLGYRLCEHISLFAPLMPGWPRVTANLARVLPEASDTTRRRHGRDVIAGLLKNYYDLLRLHTISLEQQARMILVRGVDNLKRALAVGKGAIAALPHMGNISLLAAPVAALCGTRIVVVVERMVDARVHEILIGLRRRGDVEVVEIGPAAGRKVLQALRDRSLVVLPSDRTVATATVDVSFFGAPAIVPSGAATLAIRTGAPVFTTFSYRLPDNRSMLVIDPPLVVERRDNLREDVRRVMQAIIRIFESYIRHRPGQWLMTESVWTT